MLGVEGVQRQERMISLPLTAVEYNLSGVNPMPFFSWASQAKLRLKDAQHLIWAQIVSQWALDLCITCYATTNIRTRAT